MESKACEKGAEEDPAWTTSSLTFSAAASSASWAVTGAAGTAAGGEGRTWCTLSSESFQRQPDCGVGSDLIFVCCPALYIVPRLLL